MNLSAYFRILRDRLNELGLDQDTVDRTVEREKALLWGLSERELSELLTAERLDILVASIERRNAIQNKSDTIENDEIVDQEDNHVTQYSQEEDGKTVPVIDSKTTEDDTVLPNVIHDANEESTRSISLPSDTATVVISVEKQNCAIERETVKVSPQIEKLLNENQTVRISEKDTVFFSPSTQSPEDDTVSLRDFIPKKKEESSLTDVERTILPNDRQTFSTESDSGKKEDLELDHYVSGDMQNNNEKMVEAVTDIQIKTVEPSKSRSVGKVSDIPDISVEMLRNPHPTRTLLWLIFLFMPTILMVVLLIACVCIVGYVLLFSLFAFCILCYVAAFFIPLFLSLYSLFFGGSSLFDGNQLVALAEFGLALINSSFSLAFGYFLYQPFRFLVEKCWNYIVMFSKKIMLLIRNLIRYSIKGAEKV